MLLFFTLFFILFSFWVILFIFNSMFTITLLAVGIVISIIVSMLMIKLKLYSANSEFLCLQVGFYSMFIKKIIVVFTETGCSLISFIIKCS